jgi:hypothetical protein
MKRFSLGHCRTTQSTLTRNQQIADPLNEIEVLKNLRKVQVRQRNVAQNADAFDHESLIVTHGQNFGQISNEILKTID